ncbi:MAG: peptide chain release factor-like protein [Candidatus Omnitrophota bacterium]
MPRRMVDGKELLVRMHQLQIFEKDITEKFVLSSGPGGQNVNKVATCVVLKHLPTGIQVKCQEARTQKQNRFMARVLLLKKIEHAIKQQRLKERQAKEKLKRQTRKRPKKVKEEILEYKRKLSEKKSGRRKLLSNKFHDI